MLPFVNNSDDACDLFYKSGLSSAYPFENTALAIIRDKHDPPLFVRNMLI
jgi:hypothetical protein